MQKALCYSVNRSAGSYTKSYKCKQLAIDNSYIAAEILEVKYKGCAAHNGQNQHPTKYSGRLGTVWLGL